MSYIKNVIVRNLTISGLEDGKSSVLGGDITTLMSLDYYESIFEPTFTLDVTFTSIESPLANLKLRGTERVSIEVEHQSGKLQFDDLVLNSFLIDDTVSTATIFTIRCVPPSAILNEQNRLVKRYDPKVKSSSHVENFLKNELKVDEDNMDIEETANSDGFYGNYWRPFKGIYWLARRAVSASMPEEGGSTDRVGFLFWMTKSGFKFKSIDTIVSESKNDDVPEYRQNDVVVDESNFNIYNPKHEYDQDIIRQMQRSLYGENRSYFNIHTLKVSPVVPLRKSNLQQSHLGDEELVDLDFDINDTPSVPIRKVVCDYTMRTDGTISDGDGEYDPHKTITESRMRYESLLSSSVTITVPCNVELEAGDVISAKFIQSASGTDKWFSGYYIIKDLRHTVHIKENGVQCYTYLRLVRDTPGDA